MIDRKPIMLFFQIIFIADSLVYARMYGIEQLGSIAMISMITTGIVQRYVKPRKEVYCEPNY